MYLNTSGLVQVKYRKRHPLAQPWTIIIAQTRFPGIIIDCRRTQNKKKEEKKIDIIALGDQR